MLAENTTKREIDDSIRFRKDLDRFHKVHGNGFEKTGLKDYLARKFINGVLVYGLVSHGCVKATCMGALEAGFKASILENGHSCWSSDAKDKIGCVEGELELLGIHSVIV